MVEIEDRIANANAYLWALRSNDNHWNRVKKRLAEQRARRKKLRPRE